MYLVKSKDNTVRLGDTTSKQPNSSSTSTRSQYPHRGTYAMCLQHDAQTDAMRDYVVRKQRLVQ